MDRYRRARHRWKSSSRLTTLMVAAAFCMHTGLVLPSSGANDSAVAAAWALYNQQKYAASASAFEAVIRTAPPNARLYYYAALANRAANQIPRAKQLCQYIATNFSNSPEALAVQRLFPDALAKAPNISDSLPANLKGKSVAELMQTEEGRKAVEEALAKKESTAQSGTITAVSVAPKVESVSPMLAKSKEGKAGERAFTEADIAKEGANGIDQMYYPNCWFESCMSALAMLPRGRQLMSDMIRYGDKPGHYFVRFPGDGQEYAITEEKLEKTGIHDKALWATLIECGQTLKFPDDAGGYLADGLSCLTGHPAKTLDTDSASEGELSSFIDSAVRSQNPIVCGSQQYALQPYLVIPSHAYTIIGFEPSTNMVKIRNPHGVNSQRFTLSSDPHHEKFEQLEDGVFKLHISYFRHYFSQVASSNL